MREASTAHAGALDRLRTLRVESATAEQAMNEAAAADQQAARDAVDHGKPIPPAEYPEAVERESQARRAIAGAEQLARESQFFYVQAVFNAREEFAGAAHVALFESAGPMLAAVEQALIRLRDLDALRRELDTMWSPGSRVQGFALRAARPGRDPLRGPRRELVEGLRAVLDVERPTGNAFITGGQEAA